MSTLDPLDPAERQTPLLFVWVFHVPEVVSWILPLVGDNQRAVPHWSCRNTDFGLRNIICNHCIDPPDVSLILQATEPQPLVSGCWDLPQVPVDIAQWWDLHRQHNKSAASESWASSRLHNVS